METMIQSPIKFSAGAVKELKRLMNEPGFNNTQHLRIGVKGGGCSGLSYVLGFDAKKETDADYESEGVPFIMDKAHEMYLFGMEIEWDEGLNSRGFTLKIQMHPAPVDAAVRLGSEP